MRKDGPRKRHAVTLVEILVALAILALVLAMLLPAIQAVRSVAAQHSSRNNLRQMCLALHQWADARGGRLPAADGGHSPAESARSLWAQLNVHQAIVYTLDSPTEPFPTHRFKTFLSPADPTLGQLESLGFTDMCSYSSNAQVFSRSPSLPSSIRDGLSQTLFFAERYARCFRASAPYHGFFPYERATFADGGSALSPPSGYQVYPITAGSPPATRPSRPGATFQVAPAPANGRLFPPRPPRDGECDPALPQTPHRSGMLGGFADGSVRTLAPGVSPETFWALVTPRGGEVAGGE